MDLDDFPGGPSFEDEESDFPFGPPFEDEESFGGGGGGTPLDDTGYIGRLGGTSAGGGQLGYPFELLAPLGMRVLNGKGALDLGIFTPLSFL